MSEALKIAIIGDYNFTYNSHHATNLSLDHAAEFLELNSITTGLKSMRPYNLNGLHLTNLTVSG